MQYFVLTPRISRGFGYYVQEPCTDSIVLPRLAGGYVLHTPFYVRVRTLGGNTTSHPAFRHLILACPIDDGFAWEQIPILAIPMQCTLHVHRESPLPQPHARRVERLHRRLLKLSCR
jgi:hypothetical protein